MLCVRTLSVFLPSLFNSSVVWLKPGAAHRATSAAHARIFFIIGLQLGSKPPRGAATLEHEHGMAETVCLGGVRVKWLYRIFGHSKRVVYVSRSKRRMSSGLLT